MKYPAPVLSLGVTPNTTHLVVGMVDGKVSVKHRLLSLSNVASIKKTKNIYSVNQWKYYLRGTSGPTEQDYVVEKRDKRKKKEGPHDKLIKGFHYKEAVDYCLKVFEHDFM